MLLSQKTYLVGFYKIETDVSKKNLPNGNRSKNVFKSKDYLCIRKNLLIGNCFKIRT